MKWFLYFLLVVMLILSDMTILDLMEERFGKPRAVAQIVSFLFDLIVYVSYSQILHVL